MFPYERSAMRRPRVKILAARKLGREPPSFPIFAISPIFARPESLLARDTYHFARTGGNACYTGFVYSGLRTRPRIRIADWSSVHTYPVKTVTKKATFRKRSSGWRFFEFSCGHRKDDDVTASVLPPDKNVSSISQFNIFFQIKCSNLLFQNTT